MAKIALLLFCVVGVYLELSASTSIECKYGTGDWSIVKNAYYCYVNNNPSITTRESATITSISGTHQSGKTNSDVVGFYVYSKTINYFPRCLETFFKNIKAIQIDNCNLKEVHQEDLKPFPNLVELYLRFNELEVLEEGLFDFNPDLEYIYIWNNKIVHIAPNVFDHLSKLSYLYLLSNSCIDKEAKNSTSEVKNVIQAAKSQCINSEFSSLKSQLESLEKDSKTLNSLEFSEKLAAFEKTFNSSKFSNFRPLNYKFEAIKEPKFENVILTKTSIVDTKLDSLNVLMTKVSSNVNDIKSSQSSLLSAIKTGHSSIVESINNVCTKASLNQVQENILNSQNKLSTKIDGAQNSVKSSIDALSSTLTLAKTDIKTLESSVNRQNEAILNSLKSSKTEILGSVDKVCTKESLKDLQKSSNQALIDLKAASSKNFFYFNDSINALDTRVMNVKSSQDDIKSSIGDIEAALSGLKSSQNELKSSINKIKGSQNEIKIFMDELKDQKDDNIEDKLKAFGEKIEKQMKDIDGQLTDFKADNAEKLAQIEKELTSTRHKITTTIDEKIKGIEKRLMKKLEEVLVYNLGKIVEEKFVKYI
ncbi:unnamed protein product [Chironomus riparius]|uniref:Uncharacterized protein n=1 Tax=Chironomus riparius TaxID=315576 RepID=A0A9N9S9A0_9DIPT|nr:unnamed protein product [Chironomus riparius]